MKEKKEYHKNEKTEQALKEITERLEKGIENLFDSERYREYLRVMSKFHHYSFQNSVLIALQRPDATYVAGLTSWNKNFKRNVVKGEHGIKIIAYAPRKVQKKVTVIEPVTNLPILDKDGNPITETKEMMIPDYKVAHVFDISQTEGAELPNIATNLQTSVEQYQEIYDAVTGISPVPISFEPLTGEVHGYYSLTDKKIVICEGMSELQTLKTTIHEIAHAKLHDIDVNAPKEEKENLPDKFTREVEAESIAYTVCQHYGLDTSEYSFGYIAGWSTGRDMKELKNSLQTIRDTASVLIDQIDEKLLVKEKNKSHDIKPSLVAEIQKIASEKSMETKSQSKGIDHDIEL